MTPRPANDDVPRDEPARSDWYLDNQPVDKLNPDRNPYDARLLFAHLWEKRYGARYTWEIAPAAKRPHAKIGREMSSMSKVLTAAKSHGLKVREMFQTYLHMDDPFLKRMSHPIKWIDDNLPTIVRTITQRKRQKASRSDAAEPATAGSIVARIRAQQAEQDADGIPWEETT